MGGFLITGTDTGVGKTFITYNLAKALREVGVRVGCFKPIETYVVDTPEDGRLLAQATQQSVEEIVPVRYRLPLAPYAALIEGGKNFSLEALRGTFEELKFKYDVVLVEGAGGIAVPIKKSFTYAHLAKEWELEVIIVARAGLGTLNHTYLTYFYAKNLGLKIRGVVLNGFTGEDVSERTNPRIVSEMTGFQPVCIKKHDSFDISPEEKSSLLELVGF